MHNLYAYNVADDIFFKVTNVISGAFDPDVSPDRRPGRSLIAFVGYSTDGYDIHTMEFNPQAWKQVSLQEETIPAWEGFPKTDYPVHLYDPRPSLAPKLWIPIISPEAAGLVTFGRDSLFQHLYSFVVGVDFKKREPFYYLDYVNSQLFPTISFSLSKDSQGDKQSVTAYFPLTIKLYSKQMLSLGYQRAASVPEGQQGDGESEAEAEELKVSHRLSAAWSFFSLSGIDLFHDRLSISIAGEIKKEEGSAKLEKRLILDWREYFQLPFDIPLGPHNLRLKFTAGWSDVEDPEEGFSLGGESGQFLLRGFKKDAFKGKQAISGSIEYSFPLLSIEQGLGYWPLFFDDLRASIFIDTGTTGEKLELSGLKLGIGKELNLSLVAGYFLFDFSLRLGIAQGLGEKNPVAYFTVEAAF